MKKLILIVLIFGMFVTISFAKPFEDEEEISVQGKRPIIDVEVSEYTVTILPEEFEAGIVEKEVEVVNKGNRLTEVSAEVSHVPVDLNVDVMLDDDVLDVGQSTMLRIRVELTDMQDEEKFEFVVLVKAEMR